jgi:hypothetical protein
MAKKKTNNINGIIDYIPNNQVLMIVIQTNGVIRVKKDTPKRKRKKIQN